MRNNEKENEMTTWNEMNETAQLGCIYSDSHKDVFGFRPRHMTPEQLASVEWLKNAIAKLDEMPLDYDPEDPEHDPIGDAETEYNIEYDDEPEDDGQPSEYEEWQDYFGGDDWDQGQCDYDGGFDF
jgi:hypothetical protein